MRLHPAALVALPLALVVASGCSAKTDDKTASAGGTTSSSSCAKADLPVHTAGKLTVATDTPAYDPWFADNDPTNGKGFESAVAYAVAKQLGFSADEVTWVKEPFNNSYAPGPKTFDFDINQISITPDRAQAVDFSDGYYSASQAVVVLGKKGITASSLADLASLKLGAQTGTTSLSAIRQEIKPSQAPAVFQGDNVATQALKNGQVDGIVTDLPSAFYITSEITGSKILGQFAAQTGAPEEFGLLFQKGSKLVGCVDKAIAALKSAGTLADLEKQWLSQTVSVPVLK